MAETLKSIVKQYQMIKIKEAMEKPKVEDSDKKRYAQLYTIIDEGK